MGYSYHPTMSVKELQNKIEEFSILRDNLSSKMKDMENSHDIIRYYKEIESKMKKYEYEMFDLIGYLPK